MPKIPNARSQKCREIYKKSLLNTNNSESPDVALITQARDKSMRPSTSGWSKLTSRKYVCCQMLQVSLPPLPLSGTSCNVQYSGSPQRETWSKSTPNPEVHSAEQSFFTFLLSYDHCQQ
jgi:hypothetical protein